MTAAAVSIIGQSPRVILRGLNDRGALTNTLKSAILFLYSGDTSNCVDGMKLTTPVAFIPTSRPVPLDIYFSASEKYPLQVDTGLNGLQKFRQMGPL